MNPRPATVIILAAGRGSRMFPVASPFSKTLLPVRDLPVVAYAAISAVSFVDNIIVVTNPLTSESISEAVVESIKDDPKPVITVVQPEPHGVADAIATGIKALAEDSYIVVLCGDNVMLEKQNVMTVLNCVREDGRGQQAVNLAWTYREFDPLRARHFAVWSPEPFEHGRLVEKPAEPPSRICWCGPISFRSSADVKRRIAQLRPSGRGEYEVTDLMNTYIMNGEARRFPLSGVWFDVGHKQALAEANDSLSKLTRE